MVYLTNSEKARELGMSRDEAGEIDSDQAIY